MWLNRKNETSMYLSLCHEALHHFWLGNVWEYGPGQTLLKYHFIKIWCKIWGSMTSKSEEISVIRPGTQIIQCKLRSLTLQFIFSPGTLGNSQHQSLPALNPHNTCVLKASSMFSTDRVYVFTHMPYVCFDTEITSFGRNQRHPPHPRHCACLRHRGRLTSSFRLDHACRKRGTWAWLDQFTFSSL